MDFLDWIFQNKLIEMVVSGFVGWLISRLLDPPKEPSNQQTFAANGMSVKQVNIKVQNIYHQHSAANASEANQAILAVVVGLAIAIFVAMVAYGTVVVEMMRFLVATVGFASVFLGARIYIQRVFRPSSWMMRIGTILVSCVLLWFSLNYAEDYITATIVDAQRQGYPITNLPDLVKLLGFKGLLDVSSGIGWVLGLPEART